MVVSSLLIGAALGALVSGRLADTFGWRKVLLGTAVVFARSERSPPEVLRNRRAASKLASRRRTGRYPALGHPYRDL
ncbi:hypothetical protein [Saccharopolyspora shandongensis]|uniref:hypothetical protein n=1 Tax=Saccharopolyspora shandongensis TaxID=418495 RepID=UPI0033FB0E6F